MMQKHGKVIERRGRRFVVRWDDGTEQKFRWTHPSMAPGRGRHVQGVTDGSGYDVEKLEEGAR